jgi:hypothetical protein
MPASEEVQRRFEAALASFVERVRQDQTITAAILLGSLAYDEVWEKSDIDVFLITKDEKQAVKGYCLVEDGLNIHAQLYPRGRFKKMIDGALQSSFIHSAFSRSRLLFTADETLRELYDNVHHIGSRDREIQLMKAATWVLPALAKAEKWLIVKEDVTYSFFWIMRTLDGLAQIEVIMNGEVPGREVIQQALKYDSPFFASVYTELIHGPKDRETIRAALDRINAYLDEKLFLLFKPILEYLTEAGGVRTSTELNEHFAKRAQTESLDFAYEWLADRDVIQKVAAPLHLTEKSRFPVEEAAYYYDGGDLR